VKPNIQLEETTMTIRTTIFTFVATAALGMPAYASSGGADSGLSLLTSGHSRQLALQYLLDHRSHVGAYKIAQSKKKSNPKGFDATDDERTVGKKKRTNPKAFDANYDERTAAKKKKGKGYIQPYKKP
jgi:hypothetical protein